MTPKQQPKPFDLQRAEQELARLRRRARRLEATAVAHLKQQMEAASMATYRVTKIGAFVSDVRAFVDGQ